MWKIKILLCKIIKIKFVKDESSNHVLDKNNVLTDDSHLKTDESDNSIQEYTEHVREDI